MCHAPDFITELEAELERHQAEQEELKNKVEQTAAALEDVKTAVTTGG